MSRVKKKLGSIFEVSACGMDVAVVKTGGMRWKVKVVKNYVGKHDIVKLQIYDFSTPHAIKLLGLCNCCHAEDLGCFP